MGDFDEIHWLEFEPVLSIFGFYTFFGQFDLFVVLEFSLCFVVSFCIGLVSVSSLVLILIFLGGGCKFVVIVYSYRSSC